MFQQTSHSKYDSHGSWWRRPLVTQQTNCWLGTPNKLRLRTHMGVDWGVRGNAGVINPGKGIKVFLT